MDPLCIGMVMSFEALQNLIPLLQHISKTEELLSRLNVLNRELSELSQLS